ncbi:MAG TPA: molybdopterin-dependent oxidoreductase [Symbiobacteriaceae bacterium]|nr:molybdopterin-dependent oxidoreductase [Symbiobacteriaceae bacterium]
MSDNVIRTVCPHDCPDQCSVLATVEKGRLVKVAGDPEHGFTRGFLCGKVNKYPERVHSPERLLTPLRRTGPKGSGQFVPISWDTALDEIARRWRETQAKFGGEALLGYAYSGTQGMVNRNIVRALFHALGASRMLAGTVCDSACEAGWEYACGSTPGTDPETVGESDLIVCWGANVVTTNVHLVSFIDMARERGAQLIVIDPYRTRTAKRADWHIAPRVGTDTALALGVMHVLVRDGLHDAAFVAQRTVGFERLRAEVLPEYTPERVAAITGVPAADVERLAQLYGKARAPFLRLGMGMSRNAGGGMAIRTVAILPALVGAWGKPGGGALLDVGAAWNLNYNALRRPDLLANSTREINHSTLGRALVELDDPPIKALYVAANNPAVTCPDQSRMVAGLSREDLFTVVHDLWLSDTALFADIVLPACTPFETEDLYRSYGAYYIQHGPQVLPLLGESRPSVWVVQQLAARMGLSDPVFSHSMPEYFSLLLEGSPFKTCGLVGAGPVKLARENQGPPTTYFYSKAMEQDGLPPLPGWAPETPESNLPLQLLTAPGHYQHHTAFAGVESLQRLEGEPRCLLHPLDAAARGLQTGDEVRMFNDRGHVGLHAQVTDATQPGLVVVEGHRGRSRYLSGGPLNVLTSDRLTVIGAGATYQSTRVDVVKA